MRHLALVIAGLLALSLAGCGLQSGKTVVSYNKGRSAIMNEAPQSGTYALYAKNSMNPEVRVTLEKGQELGFRKKDEDTTVAVAGDREYPLEAKLATGYLWKLEK